MAEKRGEGLSSGSPSVRKESSRASCFPMVPVVDDWSLTSLDRMESDAMVLRVSVSCSLRDLPIRSVKLGAYMAARSELIALVSRKGTKSFSLGKTGGEGSDGMKEWQPDLLATLRL